MSVSIDEDLAEGGEQARHVLASWLDDYCEGRCDLRDMQESILSVCRSDPDAPWDALALLDQYTRRGRIEPELAQSLKADIEKLVFGTAGQARQSPREPLASRSAARVSPPREFAREADSATPISAHPAPDSTTDLTHRAQAVISAERHSTVAPDESGSRWRRLLAERDADSTRPGTAFADRVLLRPQVDSPSPSGEPAFSRESVPTPARPMHRSSAAPVAPPPRLAAHSVLRDRYELLSVLGRGAAGTVYRAIDRHRAHLSESARCVAVKVLNTNYREQPAALAELEREFHQAQSLAHPNIVSVFDLDRDGDTYFIVMELLEGRLLADILRMREGRPMKRQYAFAVISSVGAALAHAHRRDVVHADLKPGNIMITSNGDVRVLDFGFARNRALDLHSAPALHEAPIASPAYASLERVNGSEPGASDDVYSLACIAYELLSGQHPFGGRSALLARAHGRRPPHIRGLTHRQSQALQRALLWTRGERKIDVIELLNALGCGNAQNALATPEDMLAPDERGARWLRFTLWAACIIAAVAAVLYFFIPQMALRDSASLATATPVAAPPADRETQTRETPPEQSPVNSAAAPPSPADATSGAAAAQPARGQKQPQVIVANPAEHTTPEASAPPPSGGGPTTLQFDKDTYVATESDASVRLVVRRSGSTRRAATFTWSLQGNSAEAGADFAAIGPGTEQISAGAREVGVTIPLVSDALVEHTELFLVELQVTEEGLSLGERSHAAVIVVDDD